MTSPSKPARTPKEVFRAIARQAAYDDAEQAKAEILAMSEAEVDTELRAAGFDPEAVAARGMEQIEKLRARRQDQAWRADATEKLARAQALFAERAARPREKLSRDELLARIEIARTDPRLGAPATVAFHKRKPGPSSDAELADLLEELEMLLELVSETEE